MSGLLDLWWVWVAAALVMAVIEVLAPGFIFLGFALGALVTAGLVWFAPGLSAAALLAIFAALSLLAWILLRLFFRRQTTTARVVHHDVNDG